MSKERNWLSDIFQSPRLRASEGFLKQERRNSIEDSVPPQDRLFPYKSPVAVRQSVPITPTYLMNSPWHIAQHEQQNLFDEFPLPCMVSNNQVPLIQPHMMRKKIDFYADEEMDPYNLDEGSPLQDSQDLQASQNMSVKGKINKDDQYIFTTGKKSVDHSGLNAKISRPRQKGLSKLSSRAFEIVFEMRSATYKQVASKLVNQLCKTGQLDSQVLYFKIQSRDQQNIKRRVYDALNVLIALGILKKEGRKIIGQRRTKKNSLSAVQQHQLLQQRQQVQFRSLLSKRQKLEQLRGKHAVIKNLIEVNKVTKASENEIIRFPFVGAAVSQLKQVLIGVIQSNIDFNGEKFCIKSNKKVKPFGDVDSLNFLRQTLKRQGLTKRSQ